MAILIGIFLLFFGMKVMGKGRFFSPSFTVQTTRTLKGVFALFVLLHHLYVYLYSAMPSLGLCRDIGFLMVGGFLFISGYGLTYGYLHKEHYLDGFFSRRLLAILIPCYFINLFILVIEYLNGNLTVSYVLQSLIGHTLNLWFVFCICVLYIGFYFLFKYFTPKTAVKLTLVFSIGYIAILAAFHYGRWWYMSTLAFPCGVFYCFYYQKISSFFQKYYGMCLAAILLATGVCFYFAGHLPNHPVLTILSYLVCTVFFCWGVSLLAMKIQVQNKFYNFLGDLSLEIYLSHAIFIELFRNEKVYDLTKIYIENDYIYFLHILLGTLLFSYCIHFVSKRLLAYIQRIRNRRFENPSGENEKALAGQR